MEGMRYGAIIRADSIDFVLSFFRLYRNCTYESVYDTNNHEVLNEVYHARFFFGAFIKISHTQFADIIALSLAGGAVRIVIPLLPCFSFDEFRNCRFGSICGGLYQEMGRFTMNCTMFVECQAQDGNTDDNGNAFATLDCETVESNCIIFKCYTTTTSTTDNTAGHTGSKHTCKEMNFSENMNPSGPCAYCFIDQRLESTCIFCQIERNSGSRVMQFLSSSLILKYVNAINNTLNGGFIYSSGQGTSQFENSCFYNNDKSNVDLYESAKVEFRNCFTDYITDISGISMLFTNIVIKHIHLCIPTKQISVEK
jgi:hypothetical protein